MNAQDLGYSVEVSFLSLGVFEGDVHIFGENVVRGEEGTGPFAEVGDEGVVLLLNGGLASRVGDWCEVSSGNTNNGGLLSGEKSPRTIPVHRDVELSAVVVHAEGSSVQTDDITDAEHDGEVLKALGVQSNSGVFGTLGGSV